MTTPPTPVIAGPGLVPLRTLADWRDLLHRVVTGVLLVLGAAHVAGFDPRDIAVAVIIPGVLGIIDAGISFVNSPDGGRRIVYAVLGLGQAVVQYVGFAVDSTPVLVVGLAAAVINSVYASQWTPTSVTTGRHARPE